MKRFSWMLLLAFAGCGPSAPPAIIPAQPVNPLQGEPTATLPSDSAPKQSDPAALALVHQALDAHTESKRERLLALRTVKFTRTGSGQSLERDPEGVKWMVEAQWPDNLRVTADFSQNRVVTFACTRTQGWQQLTGRSAEPLAQNQILDYQLDFTGEWLWLLHPLLDSETRITPAESISLNGQSAPGVQVYHPRIAPAVIHFDPKTHLLARITYQGREVGQPGLKEYRVISTQAVHGVILPKRMAQTFRGSQYLDLTTSEVEPQTTFPSTLFSLPKN